MKFTALALLLLPFATAINPTYVTYSTASDVTEHGEIDLDMQEIIASVTAGATADITNAKTIYMNGKNSAKTDSIRSLAGFSTGAAGKMGNMAHHTLAVAKYGDGSWADTYVTGLFDQATAPSTKTIATAINFLVTAPYVLRELIDAKDDCIADNATDNDAGVKAWDEGVAFYAGSTAAADTASLDSIYGQIEGLSNGAALNDAIFNDLRTGGDLIIAQSCTTTAQLKAIDDVIDDIRGKLLAAAINLLNEAHTANDTPTGEALAKYILPEINACNTDLAAIFGTDGETENLELDFPCMGVDSNLITKAMTATARAATDVVAGYTPGTDVTPHSLLDKDVLRVGILAKVGDYVNAKKTYVDGLNSIKSATVNRKLQALSKDASKMDFAEAELFAAYYGSASYADEHIVQALDGSGDFAGIADVARKEMIVKGIQYSTMYMYVLRELYDAVDDCKTAGTADIDAGVHAWDEGWMFYAGSLEGTDGTGTGQMLHALDEKRKSNYDTVGVNTKLLEHFKAGKVALTAGKCADADALIEPIRMKMNVPIIQGALRYAHKTTDGGGGDKEKAEGWAFARAVLPFINECNSETAALISKNQDFFAASPMADGEMEIFKAYQSVFQCMGVTCDDIGELEDAPECNSYSVATAAENAASGVKLAGGALAAVVAAVLVMV